MIYSQTMCFCAVTESAVVVGIASAAVMDVVYEIVVRVHSGDEERIQAFAQRNDGSASGFINRLIMEAMGVDKTTETAEDI